MKRTMIYVFLGTLCLPASVPADDDLEARAAAARTTSMELMKTLKAELQHGMEAGGPVNAIGVCNVRAPHIAADFSTTTGWDVGRTSLRLRNHRNAPDAWEMAVLEQFMRRKAAGEDPATMEYYEVVEMDGKQSFRYMKAIPTAELCLACHGKDLDPAVDAKLKALYPDDHARGYEAGDIRGAFTITQPK
jgi:hypothetical protein